MIRATFLAVLIFVPAYSQAASLPKGLCPFDAKKIKSNFTPALRRDYKDEGIRGPFERREKWYGGCKAGESKGPGREKFELQYGLARIPLRISWKAGKIEQFEFGRVELENDTWERFVVFLKTHWPRASFLFQRGEGEGAAFQPGVRYAIGEGRIVPIVDTLEQEIKEKKISKDAKIKLEERDKIQDIDDLAEENAGLALSAGDLKERIFSRFDRTAGEMAQRWVGTDAIESRLSGSKPFLTRREFSWLMNISDSAMAKISKESLREEAVKLDRVKEMPPLPRERYDHLDRVEWWMSAEELCSAMLRIKEVPELVEGLASKNFRTMHPAWKKAVYYAARDFGVSQTTWVADLPGTKKSSCFTLVLNSPALLDEEAGDETLARAYDLVNQGVKEDPTPGR